MRNYYLPRILTKISINTTKKKEEKQYGKKYGLIPMVVKITHRI
jgi:hypothetical protein